MRLLRDREKSCRGSRTSLLQLDLRGPSRGWRSRLGRWCVLGSSSLALVGIGGAGGVGVGWSRSLILWLWLDRILRCLGVRFRIRMMDCACGCRVGRRGLIVSMTLVIVVKLGLGNSSVVLAFVARCCICFLRRVRFVLGSVC